MPSSSDDIRATPKHFPSRHNFPYDPGVPDRQLWAIGMVAAQWAMIELMMQNHVYALIREDEALRIKYREQTSFRTRRVFWEELVRTRMPNDARRTALLDLVEKAKDLNSKRDRIMHQLWAGGLEGSSWSAGGSETTDAILLKTTPRGAPTWRMTFSTIRRIATEMAHTNVALSTLTLPYK